MVVFLVKLHIISYVLGLRELRRRQTWTRAANEEGSICKMAYCTVRIIEVFSRQHTRDNSADNLGCFPSLMLVFVLYSYVTVLFPTFRCRSGALSRVPAAQPLKLIYQQ